MTTAFNIGDTVNVLHAAHLPREVVSSTGVIERITHQTSDGTPLYWVSSRRTAVTAMQLRHAEQTITYTLNVTVVRPVRPYDTDTSVQETADWMVSPEAKRELEREVMLVMRRLDGDYDVEVMEAKATNE